MIQHKLSTMPSEQELEQMCARAGISDAQHLFPVETGRNPVIRIVTPARGAFLLKLSPRYGAPVLTHERGAIRTELTAYDLIRSKTNVPIPRVIFSDFSGKCVPCDWFIMEEPEGCPVCRGQPVNPQISCAQLERPPRKCMQSVEKASAMSNGGFAPIGGTPTWK